MVSWLIILFFWFSQFSFAGFGCAWVSPSAMATALVKGLRDYSQGHFEDRRPRAPDRKVGGMTYCNFVFFLSLWLLLLLLLFGSLCCARLETLCHTPNPRTSMLMQTPGQLSCFRRDIYPIFFFCTLGSGSSMNLNLSKRLRASGGRGASF